MAEEEAQVNTPHDHEREENQGKMMMMIREDDGDTDTNSTLLPGLNLALILSCLSESQSRSHQEFQNHQGLEENPTIKITHGKGKGKDKDISASSNIPRVRRQVNHGFRGVQLERQMMPKPNTKIRACRHGRKM